MTHRDKIVIVGAGNVGEAIAYTLMVRVQANDIVLIDLNEDRAKGAALDIAHGTSFFKQVSVRSGGYEECSDAKLIIITAGVARKPGQSRLDITTATVQEVSGLPRKRVIGSGTSLDTARFRSILSQKLGVNVEDVHAYVLGEHGDSQVPIFSSANVGGFLLDDYCRQSGVELDKEAIAKKTRQGGAEVIGLKGATFYGVAMAVSNIVETIVKDDRAILPVCHVLSPRFGEWAGVPISMPCRIGWGGIEKTFEISMNDEERKAMEHSVQVLKDFVKQVRNA